MGFENSGTNYSCLDYWKQTVKIAPTYSEYEQINNWCIKRINHGSLPIYTCINDLILMKRSSDLCANVPLVMMLNQVF